MYNQTLLLIKPNATAKQKIGSILKILEENGFCILALKSFIMDQELASHFYEVHKGKVFYSKLIEFMTSGMTVGVILEKENAIPALRKFVGNTNPEKAESNTVRALFGDSLTENAVHASDSIENAKREIELIFQ